MKIERINWLLPVPDDLESFHLWHYLTLDGFTLGTFKTLPRGSETLDHNRSGWSSNQNFKNTQHGVLSSRLLISFPPDTVHGCTTSILIHSCFWKKETPSQDSFHTKKILQTVFLYKCGCKGQDKNKFHKKSCIVLTPAIATSHLKHCYAFEKDNDTHSTCSFPNL